MVPALAIFFACGCSKSTEEADAGDDVPALNTNIEIAKADVPARYSAALPTTADGMRRWVEGDASLPPFVHAKDMLVSGDAKWFEKLSVAAKGVPASESEAWARRLDGPLQYEVPEKKFCDRARTVIQAPASTLRRALVGVFAGNCATDDDLALIVRDDTPDAAVLRYYQSYFLPDDSSRPYHERYGAAVRAAILEGEHGDRRAASVLARHPDPRALAALRKIHAEIRDPERADLTALAFRQSRQPRDRALAQAACTRLPEDPVCRNLERELDLVTEPVDEADYPEAKPPSPALIKARLAQLAAAGFTKVPALDPAEVDTDSADAILTMAGHAYWFDVETGMYPNNHDSLMRRLAALVSPELDDAVFEETAPHIDDETGPYTLTVYIAGERLRAEARNLGDWYDVEAVINLMNAAAKERGSKSRFVALASDDQTMAVLGAPAGAIARAIQGGLIEIGGAGEAEKAGKDFEEKVMEAFKN